MSTPTLKQRISQISIGAFLAATAVILAGFILYSATRQNLAVYEVKKDLKRTANQQIEQLIPSYLLPEQKDGVGLLLSRFIAEEDLTHAMILNGRSDLPDVFSKCEISDNSDSSCASRDGQETALIAPISEAGHTYGYLLKAKHNSSTFATNEIVQLVGVMTLILIFTFAAIYALVARLLSRTLPSALDQIVEWIEADLSDKPEVISSLPFRELEVLREKIAEVMDRHTRSQEQAAVGQLTSGIMHDIKTPLQSIVTAMHLAEKYPPDHPKRLHRLENLLKMSRDNLPIIGEIIESTLDGSRQIHLDKEACDLATTVLTAIEINHGLARLRSAEINLVCPETLSVSHDPIQMSRVLTNILKNGIESASGEKPKIQISVERSDGNRALIVVEDNGPGLKTSADRVFRAFRSSKVHGSGLGLHVSKKIVEAHNGSILASNKSHLGGARFEVRLPMSDSAEAVV